MQIIISLSYVNRVMVSRSPYADQMYHVQIPFLAPPAEWQRSFTNAESSVVRQLFT